MLTASAVSGANRVARDAISLRERLLRKSYLLAVAEHLRTPQDAGPVHLIGRIHAAMGRTEDARVCLDTALLLAPDDGQILVSMGFLELGAGREFHARKRAQAAIDLGEWMGWDVLADLAARTTEGSLAKRAESVRESVELREKVPRARREAYRGVHVEMGEAMRRTGEAQRTRIDDLKQKVDRMTTPQGTVGSVAQAGAN